MKTYFNQRFVLRMLKYLAVYFILFGILSYLIRTKGEPAFTFEYFLKIVIVGAVMAVTRFLFDPVEFDQNGPLMKRIGFAIIAFLIITLSFFLLLYLVFKLGNFEEVNAGKELLKVLLMAALLGVLVTIVIAVKEKLLNRNRKLNT